MVGLGIVAGIAVTVFSQETGGPIRVGSIIATGSLRECVPPIYSEEAQDARLTGVVILEVVIDREGAVSSVRVLTGSPVLRPAAIEAVSGWQYEPYLLNGAPTSVVSTVALDFSEPSDEGTADEEAGDDTSRCYRSIPEP